MSAAVFHVREYEGGSKMVQFYCPGCRHLHCVHVAGDRTKNPVWEWNGDLVRPTLSPSILVRGELRCHSFIRDGRLELLNDSAHDHAGETVDLLAVTSWPEPIRSYTLD